MVDMFNKADQPRGRDAGDLLLGNLNKQKSESSRKLVNSAPYVAIDKKKWIFVLLGVRFAHDR